MKIAILGSAPSSMRLAPYGDPAWKIWGCSPGLYPGMPRCDAWFELHRWEPPVIGKPDAQKPWFSPEYVSWMAGLRCPVWMYEKVPEIPMSAPLPAQELVEKFGNYFMTSSISWMMAMAIDQIMLERQQDPEHDISGDQIALYGVDMAACTSYDTKVLRADLQWVTADSLKVGDKVIAFDEHAQPNGDAIPQRRWRTAEVLEASRLTKPCYRLTLEDDTELVCSEDHQWLTYAENTARWKMAKDLVTPMHREGRPSRIIRVLNPWTEDRSWDAGYLAAAFDGDGHIHQKLREDHYGVMRCGFAQRANVMSAHVAESMRALGFELGQDSADGDCIKHSVRGGRSKNMEFLGRIRPKRLLQDFSADHLGMFQKQAAVAVMKAEFIGEQPVIGLRTSTKTFIAEGLASHNTEEYGYQRAGCQYFIQMANNLGIAIVVPPESDLLRPMPPYGICETDEYWIKATERKRELTNRLANHQQQVSFHQRQVDFLSGAIDDLNYHMQTWHQAGPGMSTNVGVWGLSPYLKAQTKG